MGRVQQEEGLVREGSDHHHDAHHHDAHHHDAHRAAYRNAGNRANPQYNKNSHIHEYHIRSKSKAERSHPTG